MYSFGTHSKILTVESLFFSTILKFLNDMYYNQSENRDKLND